MSEEKKLPIVLLLITTDGKYERSVLGDKVEIVVCPGDVSSFHDWGRVTAIVITHIPHLSLDLLKQCPRLRVISRMGIGVDNIDLKAATDLGVCVCNVPDYGIEEVADTALAHILALFRQTTTLHSALLAGSPFTTHEAMFQVAGASRRIRNKTLGLIGMGNIGMAVCMRAKAFGFKIMVYDPYLHVGIERALGGLVRADTVEELITNSDCVSLHCPLCPETAQIVNEDRLRLFKKDAFLVNTARGGLIDEEALVKALKEGRLAGIALDVQVDEPFTYKGSLFEGIDNVILTPHGGWYSKESFKEVHESSIEAVRYSLTSSDAGGLKFLLNKDVLGKEECKARWRQQTL